MRAAASRPAEHSTFGGGCQRLAAACSTAAERTRLGRHGRAVQLRATLSRNHLRRQRRCQRNAPSRLVCGLRPQPRCPPAPLTFRILSMSSSKSRLRMRSASSSTRCCSVRRLNPCAAQATQRRMTGVSGDAQLARTQAPGATRLRVRQVVSHAPGRADEHVRPLGQRDGLRHDVDAAHQRGGADADGGAERLELRRARRQSA